MNKAILLAAHGSRHPRAVAALEAFTSRVAALYPDFAVRLVYTATACHTGACGETASPLDDVLAALAEDGTAWVAALSLHVAPGKEFSSIEHSIRRAGERGRGFAKVAIAGPLLSRTEDMAPVAEATLAALPAGRSPGEAVALMGHGAHRPAQLFYDILEETLRERDPNVFFATLEGRQATLEDDLEPGETGRAGRGVARIREELAAHGIKKAWLMPFLTVAGAHAHHDLAGEGDTSWKSTLERSGVACEADLPGLLERESFAALWLELLRGAVERLG